MSKFDFVKPTEAEIDAAYAEAKKADRNVFRHQCEQELTYAQTLKTCRDLRKLAQAGSVQVAFEGLMDFTITMMQATWKDKD